MNPQIPRNWCVVMGTAVALGGCFPSSSGDDGGGGDTGAPDTEWSVDIWSQRDTGVGASDAPDTWLVLDTAETVSGDDADASDVADVPQIGCNLDPSRCDIGPCATGSCVPATGQCAFVYHAGRDCDDGDACTLSDACDDAGQCVGATMPCDDGKPCTTDACDGGTCVFTPDQGATCSDGNPCTDDLCDAAGTCTSTPIDCDDDNDCTLDTCNGGTGGCINSALTGTTCDDGDLCTLDDACSSTGACFGTPMDCGDADTCTFDGCWSGEGLCVHETPGTQLHPVWVQQPSTSQLEFNGVARIGPAYFIAARRYGQADTGEFDEDGFLYRWLAGVGSASEVPAVPLRVISDIPGRDEALFDVAHNGQAMAAVGRIADSGVLALTNSGATSPFVELSVPAASRLHKVVVDGDRFVAVGPRASAATVVDPGTVVVARSAVGTVVETLVVGSATVQFAIHDLAVDAMSRAIVVGRGAAAHLIIATESSFEEVSLASHGWDRIVAIAPTASGFLIAGQDPAQGVLIGQLDAGAVHAWTIEVQVPAGVVPADVAMLDTGYALLGSKATQMWLGSVDGAGSVSWSEEFDANQQRAVGTSVLSSVTGQLFISGWAGDAHPDGVRYPLVTRADVASGAITCVMNE